MQDLYSEEIQQLRHEHRETRRKYINVQVELERLQADNKNLLRDLENKKTENFTLREDCHKDIAELKSKNSALQYELESSKDQFRSLEATLVRLQGQWSSCLLS